MLIERGCQYAARNTEGFTPLDYAYSTSVADTLQETVRTQFEQKKSARRNVFAQAAARGNEWRKSTLPDNIYLSSMQRALSPDSSNRLRSGSGGSRTTVTSEDDNPSAPGPSSFSSISSQHSVSILSSRNGHRVPSKSPSLNALSSAYKVALPLRSKQEKAHMQPNYVTPSATAQRHPALSPVASRMRERDADAIEQYKRSRSGSGGSIVPSWLPQESGTAVTIVDERQLRPSVSAASLRAAAAAQTSAHAPSITTQPLSLAVSPEKPVARKLILTRRTRPGTADSDTATFTAMPPPVAISTSRKIPFSILPGRHNIDRSGHPVET